VWATLLAPGQGTRTASARFEKKRGRDRPKAWKPSEKGKWPSILGRKKTELMLSRGKRQTPEKRKKQPRESEALLWEGAEAHSSVRGREMTFFRPRSQKGVTRPADPICRFQKSKRGGERTPVIEVYLEKGKARLKARVEEQETLTRTASTEKKRGKNVGDEFGVMWKCSDKRGGKPQHHPPKRGGGIVSF